MFYQVCRIIAEIALFISIIDWITYRTVQKNKLFQKMCFCMLAITEMILVFTMSDWVAFSDTIFTFICMTGLFGYLAFSDNKNGFLYDFMMVVSAILTEMIMRVMVSMFFAFLYYLVLKRDSIQERNFLRAGIYIILCICIIIWGKKIPLYKLYENKGIRIISTVIGIFLIILQQMGSYASDNNRENLSAIAACILIFTIIFGVLWFIDHYRMAAGKLKVEQDNRKMNSNLHRTKELMPLLISVVNENHKLLDPQIVEEFNQIYSEQMITERKENMNYKLLGSTGAKLLDAQLQHYILECSRKGISMDAFVAEPISRKLQKMKIAQLMMHTMVGDLLRNAIRAIERGKVEDGKILFIIGMKEDILELNVFDNGAEIPLQVLENFGQRGVTTGGTGNGLADLVGALRDIQASLIIKENAPETSAYTKGFIIVFDKQNRRRLQTYREKEIKNKEFWSIGLDEE